MKALIVDDDRVLADVVAFALRREGFQVVQAYDGLSALQRWAEEGPDLVVLDVDLPGMDGFAVCQRIRREADTPIIMLTACNKEEDIVHGLDLGADVYMTKPFSPRQLVARVRAVLRRCARSPNASIMRAREAGRLEPLGRREPRRLGTSLTPLESRLLEFMQVNHGRVLSPEDIIAHIWGPSGGGRDTLRHLVRRLRGKIEPDPAQPTFLRTFPGQGYALFGDLERQAVRNEPHKL